MKIIQITNTYRGEVLDIVRRCVPEGFEIRTLPENTSEALQARVGDADYLLASGRVRIDAAVLDKAGRLRMVQRTGVGLDSIDLDALAARGIPLYVNRGVNARSVAEHALLLMLACLRSLPALDANTKKGVWEKQKQGVRTMELSGRTVGIVGMGSIGRTLAELLGPFHTRLIYTDKYRLDAAQEAALGVKWTEQDALMAESDVISLHCPLTDETRHMIRAESLARMKDGVVIVNTARGGLIREADLLTALERGKVRAAGLDVYEREPVDGNNPLLSCAGVITTPHVGGVTRDSFERMMREAMNNIRLYDSGALESIEQSRYGGCGV